jgi:hypothetical protein
MVKESTIESIERRDCPDVGIETLMRLAVILGVPIEYRWKSHVEVGPSH